MNYGEVFAVIRDVIAEIVGAEPEDITPETELGEYNIDEMDMTEIGYNAEEEFEIEVSEDEFMDLETVDEIVKYVLANIN